MSSESWFNSVKTIHIVCYTTSISYFRNKYRITPRENRTIYCHYRSVAAMGLFNDGFRALHHIDGLVQDCSNPSVLAMELLQSCT